MSDDNSDDADERGPGILSTFFETSSSDSGLNTQDMFTPRDGGGGSSENDGRESGASDGGDEDDGTSTGGGRSGGAHSPPSYSPDDGTGGGNERVGRGGGDDFPSRTGNRSDESSKEVLSIAALTPTAVRRKNGEWYPKILEDPDREGEVWEIPATGKHWLDEGDTPPEWLEGYSTQRGYHYLRIPGTLLISSSLDVGEDNLQIPWNSILEFGGMDDLNVQMPDVNEPGAYKFHMLFEIEQSSDLFGDVSNLNVLGSMTLGMDVGIDSQFRDELRESNHLDGHTVQLTTDNLYGTQYSHREALGDALETAYERLKKMHEISLTTATSIGPRLATSGATITLEFVAKQAGKKAGNEVLNMAVKEAVTEAKERLEEPTSDQLTPEQLDEASLISGTGFYATNADGKAIGMSGPMFVIRSE